MVWPILRFQKTVHSQKTSFLTTATSIFIAADLEVIILSCWFPLFYSSQAFLRMNHGVVFPKSHYAYVLAKVQSSSQHQHFPVNFNQLYCHSEVETMQLTPIQQSACVKVFPGVAQSVLICSYLAEPPTSKCRSSQASWLG